MNTYLHLHQLAKKLNNTASLCIETGLYERGITCLVEALQLSDRQNFPQQLFFKPNDVVCQCKQCSLDECIVFSERTSLNSATTIVNTDDDKAASNGYIHRRPIRITPQSLQEGHNMGVTLSLIITFNLALAHHLSALSTFAVDRDDNYNQKNTLESLSLLHKSNAFKQTFQKILYLYELAYRWQIELDDHRIQKQRHVQQQQLQDLNRFSWTFDTTPEWEASPVTSLRFNMIICNNLSLIHRLVQNETKHRRCLEHLLATIMFVVVNEDPQHLWTGYSQSASSSNTTTLARTSPSNIQLEQQQRYMDLEGFLLNVMPVILQGPCAGAA
jgi:hypothetical protein